EPDVDDHDAERIAPHLEKQLFGVPALSDHLEPVVGEQAGETLAEQNTVLGDGYAHGISALTRVPPPSGVQIRRRPPSASTRSARPRRPEPCSVSAPPIPSSTISTTSWPLFRPTSTVAEHARACLPTFARLSETT